MLFYMQMRNWFIILMILTMTYMVHQKVNGWQQHASRMNLTSAASFSIFR